MLLDFFKLSVSKIALERVFIITQFCNACLFLSALGSLNHTTVLMMLLKSEKFFM